VDDQQQSYVNSFKKKMAKGEALESIGMKELEGWRNLEQRGLVIDVVKRDVEEGRYNINVMCFMQMPGQEKRIGEALGRVCASFFGVMNPDHFDFIHFDQRKIQQKLGRPLSAMDNFCVEIKHPVSTLYRIESIKEHFLRELPRELEKGV
jgi:hypothetical protein